MVFSEQNGDDTCIDDTIKTQEMCFSEENTVQFMKMSEEVWRQEIKTSNAQVVWRPTSQFLIDRHSISGSELKSLWMGLSNS